MEVYEQRVLPHDVAEKGRMDRVLTLSDVDASQRQSVTRVAVVKRIVMTAARIRLRAATKSDSAPPSSLERQLHRVQA